VSAYRRRYCRRVHDGSLPACPLCGAPIDDWIYFSHHVLLWTDAVCTLRAMSAHDLPDRREREFPMGPFYDSFTAGDHEGLLLLHSPGNTFIRDLGDQESILVQPSSLVYWDDTVALALHLEHPRTLSLPNPKDRQNYRLVWLRLTGPGRVAVQSVYELAESAGKLDHFSFASTRVW
jgi:hypothetical protein